MRNSFMAHLSIIESHVVFGEQDLAIFLPLGTMYITYLSSIIIYPMEKWQKLKRLQQYVGLPCCNS